MNANWCISCLINLLILIFVLFLPKAFANSYDESAPIYLIGSLEYGSIGNVGQKAPPSNTRTIGFGFNAGYEFNQYFALDGGSNYIPATVCNLVMSDLAIRASLPFGPIASGFIHIGPGYIVNGSNPALENSLGLFAGFGALFNINSYLGISVEDQGILPFRNNNSYTINMITIGTIYKF